MDIYPGVRLLDHTAVLFLVFEDPHTVFVVAVLTYFPTNSVKAFPPQTYLNLFSLVKCIICKCFSHFLGDFFILITVSFAVQKHFSFNAVSFFIFLL